MEQGAKGENVKGAGTTPNRASIREFSLQFKHYLCPGVQFINKCTLQAEPFSISHQSTSWQLSVKSENYEHNSQLSEHALSETISQWVVDVKRLWQLIFTLFSNSVSPSTNIFDTYIHLYSSLVFRLAWVVSKVKVEWICVETTQAGLLLQWYGAVCWHVNWCLWPPKLGGHRILFDNIDFDTVLILIGTLYSICIWLFLTVYKKPVYLCCKMFE